MTDEALEAWILERAKQAAVACALARECRDSVIARAMRDAVAEARRLDAEARAAETADWVWEDRS